MHLPSLNEGSEALIPAAQMAGAALSRRVEKVVAYPPLCDMSDLHHREFHEALPDADAFRGSARGSGRGRS
jgi:hypothetical protein